MKNNSELIVFKEFTKGKPNKKDIEETQDEYTKNYKDRYQNIKMVNCFDKQIHGSDILKNSINNDEIQFAKFIFDFHGKKGSYIHFHCDKIGKKVREYLENHKNLKTVEIKWLPCYGAIYGIVPPNNIETELKTIMNEYPDITFLFSKTRRDKRTITTKGRIKMDKKTDRLHFFYRHNDDLIQIDRRDFLKKKYNFKKLLKNIKKLRENVNCFSKFFNTKSWQNYQNAINDFRDNKEKEYQVFINKHRNEAPYNSLKQLHQEEIENPNITC